MKLIQFLFSGILSVTTLIAGCSNSDPAPPTKTELITARPYKVQAIAVANGADVTQNVGVVSVKYGIDGSVTQTLKDGSTNTGTWKWLGNETQIDVTTKAFGKSTWRIIELNDQVFNKVTSDFTSVFGGDLRYNQTRQ